MGIPLATAYYLESKIANYPRIVLSENLIKQFQSFDKYNKPYFETDYLELLINQSCEVRFLNVFIQVLQTDFIEEKKSFFLDFKTSIELNLKKSKMTERVHSKFTWLANEFDNFIDEFIEKIAFADENFNPEEEPGFFKFIENQKINYGR